MSDTSRIVEEHYTTSGLEDRILAGLQLQGINLNALTVDDLASVDGFHIRGREATRELLSQASIPASHRVLDVGCGIGGTSRFLAHSVGCQVDGVDLTPAYCKIAENLTARVGLSDKATFHVGDALSLPFEDRTFDLVWTEHVQMNIADKSAFYSEMARVLKPGGQFVFHDIFSGNEGTFQYPVPWAHSSDISHLARAEEVAALLADLGFESMYWTDKTEASRQFFAAAVNRFRSIGEPPLGLNLVMGSDWLVKFSNLLGNLDDGLLQVIRAVMEKR